jgi:hypothetical protein
MIDGPSYIYGIILGGIVMFALGYSWGRFHARSRERWIIDIRTTKDNAIEIRRINPYP